MLQEITLSYYQLSVNLQFPYLKILILNQVRIMHFCGSKNR